MRLWVLVLCLLALVAFLVVGASLIGQGLPTAEDDHLLDNVPGIGGPKR